MDRRVDIIWMIISRVRVLCIVRIAVRDSIMIRMNHVIGVRISMSIYILINISLMNINIFCRIYLTLRISL